MSMCVVFPEARRGRQMYWIRNGAGSQTLAFVTKHQVLLNNEHLPQPQ